LPGSSWAALDPLVLLGSLASVSAHSSVLLARSALLMRSPTTWRGVLLRLIMSAVGVPHGTWSQPLIRRLQETLATRSIRQAKNATRVQPSLSKWHRPYGTAGNDDDQIADQAARLFSKPGAISPINYRGKHFYVDGPLNVPRSPQGHPVLIQAGGSPAGLDFAARSTARKAMDTQSNLCGRIDRSYPPMRIRPIDSQLLTIAEGVLGFAAEVPTQASMLKCGDLITHASESGRPFHSACVNPTAPRRKNLVVRSLFSLKRREDLAA
jgi:hypothetical protein